MDGFDHIGVEKSLSSVEIFLFPDAVVNLLAMTAVGSRDQRWTRFMVPIFGMSSDISSMDVVCKVGLFLHRKLLFFCFTIG